MAVITLPTNTIIESLEDMSLLRGDVALETMTGSSIIVAPPIAVWLLTFRIGEQQISTAREWMAAQAQLSKLSNTFLIQPPGYFGPSSAYAGANPLVNGASQTGLSLICDGVSNSTLIVNKGDYIEVNNEFKIVTADATSDGSGNVTISFEPALRASPDNNATVDVADPQVTCRFINPRASWSVDPSLFYKMKFFAIESF